MKKIWLIVSLVNFLIASLMGFLLRGAFVWEIGWMDYKNLLHGHSHLALMGWLYLGMYIVIHAILIPIEKADKPIYKWLFWLTQLSVLGMAIAFPQQGYASLSILFSCLHILLSYLFCIRVWKGHNRENKTRSLLQKTIQHGTDFKVLIMEFNKGMIFQEHKAHLESKLTVLEGIVIYKK